MLKLQIKNKNKNKLLKNKLENALNQSID